MMQTADEIASAPAFLQWCQNSALSHLVRHEVWTIPLIEITHIVGVVLVFGSVLVTNLRLLGLDVRERAFEYTSGGSGADHTLGADSPGCQRTTIIFCNAGEIVRDA